MNLSLLYIASGFSRRFGGNKLLAPLRGKPLFQHGLMHLQEAVPLLHAHGIECTICVVTQYPEIMTYCQTEGLNIIENSYAVEGMAASIRVGVTQTKEADGWAIFAADQPFLDSETIADFLYAFVISHESIGTVTTGARRGSPAVFLRPHRGELLGLRGDLGGRQLLQQHEASLFLFPVSPTKLIDMDTRDMKEKHDKNFLIT